MGLLNTIHDSAFATWVRESPSIFAYTTILSLHAMGLAIIVGINTIVALRLLGYGQEIPVPALRKLFPWMYLGFTINALSGFSLLASNAVNDLTNWMFYSKLGFIALAMVNLELTRVQVFDRPAMAGGAVAESGRAKTFAVTSIVLWSLAICAGRLTEYPNFVQAWFGF
jgi:hypothetical protein